MKEKGKGGTILMVLVAVIAVTVLGVSLATFQEVLTIDGTGTVESASWQVRFENLSAVSTTGTATEVTAPTINTNDTNIGDYDVTFTTPGDSVSYTFDVANNGTFDAEISSITIPTPTCEGNGDNATTDATNVCNHLEYKLTYSDGSAMAVGDALNHGESKTLKLTLTYKDTITASELPTDDVKIGNLSISINYSQK